MIQLDCIKYIVNLLKNEGHVLSDEILEYANAMLMNMCLKVAGKMKCEEIKSELIQVLFDNLEHENNQVWTYINGTLYSILNRKKLREEAKAIGLDTALQHLQNSD